MTPTQRARLVFDALDADRSGFISKAELGELLVSWGLPRTDAVACLRDADHRSAKPATQSAYAHDSSGAILAKDRATFESSGDALLDFDEFYENLRSVWEFASAVVDSNSGVEERVALKIQDLGRRLGISGV
eukprot:scaffold71110_cov27-Tisochrysis_lutea.AAC.2